MCCNAWIVATLLICAPVAPLGAQTPRFDLPTSLAPLEATVRPGAFFDVTGRRAAVLGREDGTFEAWVFPFQLLDGFKLQFRLDGMAVPEDLGRYASHISVTPERTTIRYSHPLFVLRQHFIIPAHEAGIVLLLDLDAYQPVELFASLYPRLQPMWPAGLGGQYAFWDEPSQAYIISESRRRFNAMVGGPGSRRQSPPLAHELAQKPNLFALTIDPDSAKTRFYPIILTADFSSRDSCRARYARLLAQLPLLYHRTHRYYDDFLRRTVALHGTEFDAALAWNKLALHRGFVCTGDLGCGMVAGFGPSGASRRPGFAWFFGGDMFVNSLAMTAYGDFDVVKRSIQFLQERQRADGKMMHELTQAAGLLDWFGDFPYGYIHGDTTPLYLIALHNYFLHTADSAFVRESWPSIERAYTWSRRTDSDGDGLMENTLAGLGASELGSLREASGVDIFLAASGVEAWRRFAALARIAGVDTTQTADAERWFATGAASLEQKFWNAETKRYNFSLTRTGAPNAELTAWIAFPMIFDLLEDARSRQALAAVASSQITTDWGSRMLASSSRAYEPLAYNNGAVWPFLTGYTTWAFYRQHNVEAGLQNLRNLASWLEHDALGVLPEVTSGAYFRQLETSVPHQLFSSFGFVAGLLRGLLDLQVDAPSRTLYLAPNLPVDWQPFAIDNIIVAGDTLALRLEPAPEGIILRLLRRPAGPITIDFRPAFGPFARIDSLASTAGIRLQRIDNGRSVQVAARFSTAQLDSLRIAVHDPLRLWMPYSEPAYGDPPRQMRWLRGDRRGDRDFVVELEAPGGSKQTLRYRATGRFEVDGATRGPGETLQVTFPGSGYVKRTVTLRLLD